MAQSPGGHRAFLQNGACAKKKDKAVSFQRRFLAEKLNRRNGGLEVGGWTMESTAFFSAYLWLRLVHPVDTVTS